MSEVKNEIEDAEVTDIASGDDNSGKGSTSKVLSIGKYFLLVGIIVAQAWVAYKVIDQNYEKIYSFLNAMGSDDFGIYQLEELIVNPAATNGQRYLLVEISMELEHSDDVRLLEQNKMEIKENIIEVLSSRTVDQLAQVDEREKLKSRLEKIINSAVGVRSVRNLYFTKYVMQ